MKTTPEGLTHLINMLVDVVNLQRKAQGTPGACCEVELRLNHGSETIIEVQVSAVVNVAAAPPKTLSTDNNRPLTPEEEALEAAGFERPRAGLT